MGVVAWREGCVAAQGLSVPDQGAEQVPRVKSVCAIGHITRDQQALVLEIRSALGLECGHGQVPRLCRTA